MKNVVFFCCLAGLVTSCKKDDTEKVIRYTSDAPTEFTSSFLVSYDEQTNLTTASALFWDEVPGAVASSEEVLRLPSNSYLHFNGASIATETADGPVYRKEYTGKMDGLFEFLNFDQTLYSNFLDMPDTVFLVNLADTIDASQDLLLTFGGTPMENNETVRVSLSANNDYGDFYDVTSDSTMIIPKSYLRPGQQQQLLLSRSKTLLDPNLPVGGGNISCNYKIQLMIYSE